ncbi:hypothetical protein AMATHDRAFT_80991 [Amanita thiersii Skay4041]|uniref:Methyltransferase domain-containing protein n=1 Tax=Amanita thiersii Skay4041 TaxID=703135 RepID=A0A2A9NJ42_9AGAR|nr:hypothetical protein AMATHDRAFT_80991 [Amanita thiersii Skay4041]
MPGLLLRPNGNSGSDDDEPYDSDQADEEPLSSDDETHNEIVEIETEEFPTYFIERDGRLFHSQPNAPYPLPVDTPEQERLNWLHSVLYRLFNAHYVGPVPDVLTPTADGRRRMVLDLCTGTGRWVMDMGAEYPEALFRGVDIVPIATRYPLPNVQFEMHDISQQLRWNDGTFDFIHARGLAMAVRNWPALIQEIARLLRPGGLFLSSELGLFPAVDPSHSNDPRSYAPASTRFFEAIGRVLHAREIPPAAQNVPIELMRSQRFANVTVNHSSIPIGGWHSQEELANIGQDFRRVQERFTSTVTPLLQESGLTQLQVAELIADYLQELDTVQGLVSVYYTTFAFRI